MLYRTPVRLISLATLAVCLLALVCRASFPVVLVSDADDLLADQVDENGNEEKLKERVRLREKVEEVRKAAARKEPADSVASDDAAAADQPVVAKEVVEEKEEAARPQKGVVRQKVAAGAAVAAEAAEEVGQVLGDILGGLFGGRNRQPQAQIVNGLGQLEANALQQFEAHYGRHFDQILRTELHFIRIVCQPSRQQYEAMAADGKLVRTKVINKFAMIEQGMNHGQNQSTDSDTRKPVAEGLLISAKRHLLPDQVAAYERELAARNEAHKDVAVLVTTAKLDRKLVLNSDQRAQVTKLLDENWHESWGSAPMLMYGGQYFPDVPDTKLIPMLTGTQRKVWKTVDQQSQAFWGFNVGMNQGIALAEEQWADEPEEKAPTAAAAKGENSKIEKPNAAGDADAVTDDAASVAEDSE